MREEISKENRRRVTILTNISRLGRIVSKAVKLDFQRIRQSRPRGIPGQPLSSRHFLAIGTNHVICMYRSIDRSRVGSRVTNEEISLGFCPTRPGHIFFHLVQWPAALLVYKLIVPVKRDSYRFEKRNLLTIFHGWIETAIKFGKINRTNYSLLFQFYTKYSVHIKTWHNDDYIIAYLSS